MPRIPVMIRALACATACGLLLSSPSAAQTPYDMMQQALMPAVFAKSALEKALGAPLTCETLTIDQGRDDADAASRITRFAQSKGWRSLSTQDVMGGRATVYLRDPSDKRKLAIGAIGADSMYAIMSCQASAAAPTGGSAVTAPLKTLPNTVHNTAARFTATDFCKKYKCQVIRRVTKPQQYFPANEEVLYRLNNGMTLQTNQILDNGELFSLRLFYSAKVNSAVTTATVKDFATVTFGKAVAATITPAGLAKCRTPQQDNHLLWFRPFKPGSHYGDALKCHPDHLESISA